MKRVVNGKACELPEDQKPLIRQGQDRLWVQSEGGTHSALVVRRGDETLVSYRGRTFSVKPIVHGGVGEAEGDSGELRSPLPGQVVEVSVLAGQSVAKGQRLLVMEAMKMQQPVQSPFDGTVDRVMVALGDQVTEGQTLIHVSPNEPI
jgi:3-methylcrotonyl-CoA carboxylase alpha subunit